MKLNLRENLRYNGEAGKVRNNGEPKKGSSEDTDVHVTKKADEHYKLPSAKVSELNTILSRASYEKPDCTGNSEENRQPALSWASKVGKEPKERHYGNLKD